jgi:hypothetical protein
MQVRKPICLNCHHEIPSAQDGDAFCSTYCRRRYYDYEYEGLNSKGEQINADNLAENDVDAD